MEIKQQEICERFGAPYLAAPFDSIAGVAIETFKAGAMPVYGVRIQEGEWYIYAGEYSAATDFYKPVHIAHLVELYPQVLPYLGLGAGWKFIIDDQGYEDVWYEE
jgi:hypothetical protein